LKNPNKIIRVRENIIENFKKIGLAIEKGKIFKNQEFF